MEAYLVTFVNYLIIALNIALFARVISSWIQISPNSPLYPIFSIIYQITEPILAPIRQIIRQVLPGMGMLDFSPMVAIFLLWGIQWSFFQVVG